MYEAYNYWFRKSINKIIYKQTTIEFAETSHPTVRVLSHKL